MKISIITLFPGMFDGPFRESIIKRAQEKKLVEIEYIDLRQFGIGAHKMVDDTIYGGGTGMILRVDVVDKAIEFAKKEDAAHTRTVLLDARGKPFNQHAA